ncbi:unnamed protein product [Rotaria sordida]|uniref:FAM50A/XAP5 C-terminal domain-containing protein n=1 Tax=Rotaria sordida TaxID=392033 RepID=A0A815JA41_9BILA|nr:unnamed protein product [Rotaria sordida]CAF1375251.1 unnamed protein product [Rotaria sordida]CAF1394361.1 unnamed protein product [Rotaria sordida]
MAFFPGATKDQMRADQLVKRRQQEHEQMEMKKRKIEEDNRMQAIEEKFKAHYDAVEQMLKTDTVGLVSLDEMKKKQEEMIHAREQQLAREKEAKLSESMRNKLNNRKDTGIHQRPNKLSFADEWEEEEEEQQQQQQQQQDNDEEDNEPITKKQQLKNEEPITTDDNSLSNDLPKNEDVDSNDSTSEQELTPAELDRLVAASKKKRLGKNPDVDTSFLPDKDREEEERILREKLRQEWVEKQQRLKNEEVDLVFSYWDGSGHRRSVRIKKRMTIQMFLSKALEILRRENMFNELKSASVDQLIFVKDDVILPHHYSFYDFIVTRARGRTGLLFTFTEPLKPNAIIEVPATATTTGMNTNDSTSSSTNDNQSSPGQISHAGKICLRAWYERNKHIFPSCRWEPYDPEKRWTTHEQPKNRFCVK